MNTDHIAKTSARRGRPRKQRTARDLRSDIAAHVRVINAIELYVATRVKLDRTFEPDGDYTIEGTTRNGSIRLLWRRGTARSNEPYRVTVKPGDLVDPEATFEALRSEQDAEIHRLRVLHRKYRGIDLTSDDDDEDEAECCGCEECDCEDVDD